MPFVLLTFLAAVSLGSGLRGRLSACRVRARLDPPSATTYRERPSVLALVTRFGVPGLRRRVGKHGVSALALAMALDDVARGCASGASLSHAFVDSPRVSALTPTFDHALVSIGRGSTLAEALTQERTDDASLALAIHVLVLCARVGGNVSESLDRAAAALRERDGAARERIAQSAHARLSARALTLVPLVFASWTILTSPRVRGFMLSPVGMVCLCVGLALNLAGSRAMRRIIEGVR